MHEFLPDVLAAVSSNDDANFWHGIHADDGDLVIKDTGEIYLHEDHFLYPQRKGPLATIEGSPQELYERLLIHGLISENSKRRFVCSTCNWYGLEIYPFARPCRTCGGPKELTVPNAISKIITFGSVGKFYIDTAEALAEEFLESTNENIFWELDLALYYLGDHGDSDYAPMGPKKDSIFAKLTELQIAPEIFKRKNMGIILCVDSVNK